MQRIVILGCSGGGKSTLARRLGERLGLPTIHLDVMFWRPGWVESERPEFAARVAAEAAKDRWVMEGNYSITFASRLPRADLVVVIEQPRRVCMRRVLWRSLSQWGRSRPDMAPGCPERFDMVFLRYVWNYQRDSAPKVDRLLETASLSAPVVRLRSDAEIAAFLEGLPAPVAAPRAAAFA